MRKKKLSIYLLTSLLVIVMSWEYQRSVSASLVASSSINQSSAIPEEAMRLRILANSDSPRDQWLKREIRDEVVQQITKWVEDLETVEEARQELQLSLEDIEAVVDTAIQSRGFTYSFDVEYGQIQFPAKLYGNQLYPAGEYEGLLITIGAGQGDNWWCVLFPPLCFVNFGTGEVLDPDQEAKKQVDGEEMNDGVEQAEQIEVRFFLFELFVKVKNMFA